MTGDTMNNETWLPVPNYEQLYEVSDLGRVRAITKRGPTKPGRIIKPYAIGSYMYVRLEKDRERRAMTLHGVVLSAFNPQQDALLNKVMHLDQDQSNCALINLHWCTLTDLMRQARAKRTWGKTYVSRDEKGRFLPKEVKAG
jgi:hypothetical protein